MGPLWNFAGPNPRGHQAEVAGGVQQEHPRTLCQGREEATGGESPEGVCRRCGAC